MLALSPSLSLGTVNRGFTPVSMFAGGANGMWLSTTRSKLWQDAAGTVPATADDDPVGRIDDISGHGNNATQGTTAAKPKYKTGGFRRYAGTDDVLIGVVGCVTSGNTMAMKIKAPASLAANQVAGGLRNATAGRFYIAINTAGQLCGGVGGQNESTIKGTTDIRGTTGVATLVEDGVNVFLYWNSGLEYTGARSGAPATGVPFYEGAFNNNGAAANFFIGDVYENLTVQKAMTASERANLLTFWSA